MKKFMPILAVAALAMLFTSCKKEYTCTCSVSVTGMPTETTSMKTEKMSKKDAKAKCEEPNGTFDLMGISTTIACKID